jgi:hypothetical protein
MKEKPTRLAGRMGSSELYRWWFAGRRTIQMQRNYPVRKRSNA